MLIDNTIFGFRENQARLEQELDRLHNRRSWQQGQGCGYQEPKLQRKELDAPCCASIRPSSGLSTVTPEGNLLATRHTGLAPPDLQSRGRRRSTRSLQTGVTFMPAVFASTGARKSPQADP